MSGQVILLTVMLGASEMGVGGKVAVLGSDLLRIAHDHCQSTSCTIFRARANKGLATKGACESGDRRCRFCLEHAGLAA
jgi:hypothetical protein